MCCSLQPPFRPRGLHWWTCFERQHRNADSIQLVQVKLWEEAFAEATPSAQAAAAQAAQEAQAGNNDPLLQQHAAEFENAANRLASELAASRRFKVLHAAGLIGGWWLGAAEADGGAAGLALQQLEDCLGADVVDVVRAALSLRSCPAAAKGFWGVLFLGLMLSSTASAAGPVRLLHYLLHLHTSRDAAAVPVPAPDTVPGADVNAALGWLQPAPAGYVAYHVREWLAAVLVLLRCEPLRRSSLEDKAALQQLHYRMLQELLLHDGRLADEAAAALQHMPGLQQEVAPGLLQRCGLPPGAQLTGEQLRSLRSALRTVGTPGRHVVMINAFAGTAKSSTLKLLMHSCPPGVRCLYTAYNRAVVEDAVANKPPHVTCSTTHKLAGSKMRELLDRGWNLKGLPSPRDLWGMLPGLPYYQGRRPALDVAVVVRKTLDTFTTSDLPVASAVHLPQPLPNLSEPPNYVAIAQQMWDAFVSGQVPRASADRQISVSHNTYLKMFVMDLINPLKGPWEQPGGPFDVIMVDEAQDMNPVSLQMLMSRQNVTVILVGDRHQHIYSFNNCCNALSDGVLAERGLHQAPVKHFTLSSSFRLGPEVAEVANRVLWELGERQRPLVGARQSASAVYRPVLPAAAGNAAGAAAGGGGNVAAAGGQGAEGQAAAAPPQAAAAAAAAVQDHQAQLPAAVQAAQAQLAAPAPVYEQVNMLHEVELSITDQTPLQLESTTIDVGTPMAEMRLSLARPPVNPVTARRFPLWYLCRYNRTWVEVAVSLVQSPGLDAATAAGRQGIPDVRLFLTADVTYNGKIKFLEDVLGVYSFMNGGPRFSNYQSPADLIKAATEREDPDLLGAVNFVLLHGEKTEALVKAVYKHRVLQRAAADYILGTCHKAKGQEEAYVQLAEDFEDLADGRNRDIDIDEYNLIYVALTRAKTGLVLNYDLSRLIDSGLHRPVLLQTQQQHNSHQPGTQGAAGGAGQPEQAPVPVCSCCRVNISDANNQAAAAAAAAAEQQEPDFDQQHITAHVAVSVVDKPMCITCLKSHTVWAQLLP